MNGEDEKRTQYTLQFLAWLEKFDPELHATVMEQLPPPPSSVSNMGHYWQAEVPGMGQFPTAGFAAGATTAAQLAPEPQWWEKALDVASKAGAATLQFLAQKQVIDVQKERIKQGLPPIPTEVLAPTVRVQHDLPPVFQEEVKRLTIPGNLLLWGAIGVGAFFLLRNL